MKTKPQRSFRKRFIKISLVLIAVLVLFIAGSYVWFVGNSKRLLIDLVNDRSHGRLSLQLAEVTFNFTNNTVKIREAKITSTTKNVAPVSYQVSCSKITLHTNSIWSLLLSQSLRIREIKVFDPIIEVYNNYLDNEPDLVNQLFIGAELGKIYNSIQEGISALHTHSIYINNAKLILNNKNIFAKKPVVFSNIYFTLKKLNKFNNKPVQYLENNDVDFSSSDQDITLSDGIHKLLFKKLSIKQARSIILDSCTIIALPTHASGNNYTISFKKLALVGVDFGALYRKNIIRADSVYCESPVSKIVLNSTIADSDLTSKGIPDLERIIRNLSGNLDLGFIGATNADIHLDIKGKKTLSNFHSGKVNFQIKNLRINPDSSKPVTMRNFDMMVKGYHLYNTDSTSIFSFDSIRFENDKLLLNNFSVHTTSGKNKIRNYRDYNVSFFELLGINWSELIFRQNLKARVAILHAPVINFKKYKEVAISKKSILFNSHHSLDDFMDIDKLKIINGTININWGISNSLQLSGLDINLLGNNLTDYKHVNFNNDIESLFFTTGILKTGDINTQLQNVTFNANDQVLADELVIKDNNGDFNSKIRDVSINKITSDRNNGNFVVDGLKWNSGVVKIDTVNRRRRKHKVSSILLENVDGKKTLFQINKDESNVSAFINTIQIAYLLKKSDHPFIMKGLLLDGQEMTGVSPSTKLTAGNFYLSDNNQDFKMATLEQNDSKGNLSISAPSIHINAAIDSYSGKDIHIKNMALQSPEINYKKENDSSVIPKGSNKIATVTIDHISIHEPVLNVQNKVSGSNFSLPYSKAGQIKINNIKIDSEKITAGELNLTTGKAEIDKENEKALKIDSSIALNLENINLFNSGNQSKWSALLNTVSLKNSGGFSFKINDNVLSFRDISIGNVLLNSASISNPLKILTLNPAAHVSTSSAKYITKNSTWLADNVDYNGIKKKLTVDSVNYHPLLSRDSAIALSQYQTDYIYAMSGKVVFNGFDLAKLFNDDSLSVREATLTRPSIHVYRDKFPPFPAGVRKKLFTEQIKGIDLPVSINGLTINDGQVSYIEKNARSRLDGNLLLTHLNGNISNIKNYELRSADSLTLHIKGLLLDKEPFDIELHQSYKDSLYGFVMNLQMDPMPFDILNPLLAPLSNVKFVSGGLNDLKMHVIGNDNFAYGKMKFYYHNLHIHLLKNGGLEKPTFLKSTESNLVNFFFLKNNNTSRTGLIYFKRLKDRSFFNYINKIIFSGVSTSAGASSNSSYRKFFRKNNISNFE